MFLPLSKWLIFFIFLSHYILRYSTVQYGPSTFYGAGTRKKFIHEKLPNNSETKDMRKIG